MSCKISHWLDQLNITQDKKEELFAHELDAWDKMAKSKLFIRKGDKILMPKNEYGKAVSVITKINKSLPHPIVRITKQEIGEVVKVNATPLVEITSDSNDLYFQQSSSLGTFNKSLDEKLVRTLTKYNFKVNESTLEEIEKKYGISAIGVTDLLNKIITVSNSRNEDTLPEEFGHAIMMLLGKNNPVVKQLMDTVGEWEEFKTIKEEYEKVYGKHDVRLKFEACGKLIAKHIIHQETLSSSKLKRLLQEILDFLKKIFGKDESTFDIIASSLAKSVVMEELLPIDNTIPKDYVLLDKDKSIASDPLAQKIVEKLKGFPIWLSGSLAIAANNTIYRHKDEEIHDLDFSVKSKWTLNNIGKNLETTMGAVKAHDGIVTSYNYCETWIVPDEDYEFAHVSRNQHSWRKGLIKWNSILRNKKTGKHYYMHPSIVKSVDIFINEREGKNGVQDTGTVFIGKQNLKKSSLIFFGREKDQKDYVLLSPSEEGVIEKNWVYYSLSDKPIEVSTNNQSQPDIKNADTGTGEQSSEIKSLLRHLSSVDAGRDSVRGNGSSAIKRVFFKGNRLVSGTFDINRPENYSASEQSPLSSYIENTLRSANYKGTSGTNLQEILSDTSRDEMERGMAALERIAEGLLSDSFNGRLFTFIKRKLGGVELRLLEDSPNSFSVFDKVLYICPKVFVDSFNKMRMSDPQAYLDMVLSEELIHLVVDSFITEKDYGKIREEIENIPEFQRHITDIYNFPKPLKGKQVIDEYLRMLVQQEFFGKITELEAYNKEGWLIKIVEKAWKFILDFLKEFYSEHTKGVVDKATTIIKESQIENASNLRGKTNEETSNTSSPEDRGVDFRANSILENRKIPDGSIWTGRFTDNGTWRKTTNANTKYTGRTEYRSVQQILREPGSGKEKAERIANYFTHKLYFSKTWYANIAQDLSKRDFKINIGIANDENGAIMSQYENNIILNVVAIENAIVEEGDISDYLEKSFGEEFIHLLTFALSTEEDLSNIEKELPDRVKKGVSDYYYSEEGTIPLSNRNAVYEYIRMVVQQKLLNETTEDAKQRINRITPSLKNLLDRLIDYLISFFEQNPESVSSKLIDNILDVIEEESVGTKSLRRYKDLSNEIHNSELKQKQIEHILPTEATPELKDTFIDFLKKINPDFKVEILDDLILRRGLNGVVNFKEFIISLQRGKEEKLGEEVAHLLVEMLEKDSPLFLRMNDEITRTRLYKDVVKRYREVYGNDTQRLKKEAMAQLIHLYLVDKENFKKWSGSDSLVENLVKWIKDFFQWLKGNKEISSFILAANKIVNLDTSDLTNKQIPYDEMFSLADERTVEEEFAKKMRVEIKTFHSLGGRQVDKYKKVYININDTIFDTISYQKEHPGIDIWGIHTGDQTNLREYYRTVELTALGRELKDKIEEIGKKNVIFYTEAFINQVLLDRLVDLYGINPNQVKPRKKVDMVDLPDGTSRELESEDIAEEIDDIEGRVLVIDNSRAMIVSKEKVPYSAIKSKYEPLLDKHLQARADAQRKTISENYYAEMERLGIKTFSREIQQTFDLIKREFNNSKALRKKIEEFNSVDLQNFFEDNQGNVGIPIQISLDQKIQVSKDRLELHEREVMNFVRTLESATQYYKYLSQDGLRIVDRFLTEGPEGTRLAIWELNRMTSSARAWQGHIEMMLASIAGKSNTELTKTLYNNLLGAIKELNDLATKKATEAISERLIPIFEGYDYGKKALIKDFEEKRDSTTFEYHIPLIGNTTRTTTDEDRAKFQRQIDEIEKNGVTKERITRILLGEETDINPLTVWIKTLMNSSNPLMAGLNIMIGKDKWEADAATIRQTQDVIFEIEELRKKTGLSDDKFFEEITQMGKARVWNKKKDDYEWVDRLELLNPYQDRHILDQRMEEVEKIHERYNKATGEEKEELRALWLSERAKFEKWKHENFYDDYLQEYYFRFDPLKAEYGELLDEALELYRSYSSEIRRLGDELNQANFQDQKRIHHQILLQVSEQRRLKSQYNQDGTLKDEKGQKVAEILQKRTEIDKNYHEFEVNHDKFKRDFLAIVNSEGLGNTEVQNINLHLFTKEYAKLYDYIKELKNTELLSWLDLHLKTVYSQEFYDTRTVITQTLTSLINQLNEAYGEEEVSNMDELWQEIQGLTTTYRDEDGYLDGSIMNDKTQIKVKELEEQIERIKELTRAERIGKTSKEIKELKKAISEEIEKLKELQSKETTDSYEETFQDMAVNTKLDEFIKFGYNTPTDSFINSPEFLVFLQEQSGRPATDISPEILPHPFISWFKRNHLQKQRFISDGITGAWEFYWSPTYVWMKIEPNNKAYIQAQPSFGYTERKVKDEFHTPKNSSTYLEHSDTWLPFSDEFISDRWKAFIRRNDSQGRTLQELRDKLESFHFESQSGDISDSKIDWFLPSVQRNTLEAPSIKSMYKDFLDKTNRFEEGEGNPDEAQMGNRGFNDRMKAFFHQGFLNIHKHFTEDAGDPRNKIPVPYAYHMEPKDVSKDVIAGIMLYRGGTLAANNFLESIPTLNLSIRVLEDNTNPYMRDLEENYDEKGNLKKKEERTRLVEGTEFTRSKAFGRNKVYEMGVGADRFLTLVRKINTMGSLSDLTGWANNLKNNFAGRVQNLINADFANWSSARSMQKATWYKKNNFFWFLNQSDKKVKEVDWHIMAYFNPTLTNEMVQLTLPGATKRFLKTHINSWSSHILEFSVSSNTLYAHLFDKKVERQTPTGKEVKSLHEILTIKNNGLSVQEGWIDSRTKRPINDDYLLDTRKSFISVLEYINGKVSDKTFLSTTTMGSSILYFKNWLIPMLRRRFDSKKANYALEEDIEGYWNTFGKFIWQFVRHQKNVYPTLSPMEQANINSAVKEMLVILTSSALVAFAFGFDYDDKDKFKKLRQKTYAERLALLLLIQTQAETESLSVSGLGGVGGSNIVPPILQEGYRFIKSPLIGLGSIDNLLKAVQYTWGLPQYAKDMPLYNIEEEDYKALHYAGKVVQLDDFQYTYSNPEGRLFTILSILRR